MRLAAWRPPLLILEQIASDVYARDSLEAVNRSPTKIYHSLHVLSPTGDKLSSFLTICVGEFYRGPLQAYFQRENVNK